MIHFLCFHQPKFFLTLFGTFLLHFRFKMNNNLLEPFNYLAYTHVARGFALLLQSWTTLRQVDWRRVVLMSTTKLDWNMHESAARDPLPPHGLRNCGGNVYCRRYLDSDSCDGRSFRHGSRIVSTPFFHPVAFDWLTDPIMPKNSDKRKEVLKYWFKVGKSDSFKHL